MSVNHFSMVAKLVLCLSLLALPLGCGPAGDLSEEEAERQVLRDQQDEESTAEDQVLNHA